MKAPAFLSRWFNRNGTSAENGSSHSASEPRLVVDRLVAKRVPNDQSLPIPADQVMGAARCRHCGADLEVVCPNGHGGADDVLAELTAPKRAPAPKAEESVTLNCSVTGCDAPRVPWKGRGRKPTRCIDHLTKHQEKKSA